MAFSSPVHAFSASQCQKVDRDIQRICPPGGKSQENWYPERKLKKRGGLLRVSKNGFPWEKTPTSSFQAERWWGEALVRGKNSNDCSSFYLATWLLPHHGWVARRHIVKKNENVHKARR